MVTVTEELRPHPLTLLGVRFGLIQPSVVARHWVSSERMIAIDALLAGDGLIIDLAAEALGVVGRSVRRSLDLLRQLAGPTVFEIDEAAGCHRHWYAKDVKPLFAVNVKLRRRGRS